MPSLITDDLPSPVMKDRIIKFTNCRLVLDDRLVEQDLWVSASTGKIVRSQEAFYDHHTVPDSVIDLDGRLIAPGFIDVQLNGAFGFDFSVLPVDGDMSKYATGLAQVSKGLVRSGVTSYLPTLTSQRSDVYRKALPLLGPSGHSRLPEDGSESLGAHCEGPFLSPTKNGIHNADVLLSSPRGFEDFEDCYGEENLRSASKTLGASQTRPAAVKMITAAPEMGQIVSAIPEMASRDIIFSIGHSECTYEDAAAAVRLGATMVTHLFNAMRPLHHRNPGIFGVLGTPESVPRPYFGVIADGIHLHPASVKIAFNAHPDGFILVTDAMRLAGLPDGVYDWTNGARIVKSGALLTLEGSDKIAGSSISLVDCVSNFLNWSGASIPEGIRAVTSTPAKMLGVSSSKGTLNADADADLVILSEGTDDSGGLKLFVDQVWKFGAKAFDRDVQSSAEIPSLSY
ncbi:MAG: hypothetical protein M1837_002605 [Sclerophora amabilis]|nr:MAG: hypothetical protein M1837_002605 [Sclerophora amabilis]